MSLQLYLGMACVLHNMHATFVLHYGPWEIVFLPWFVLIKIYLPLLMCLCSVMSWLLRCFLPCNSYFQWSLTSITYVHPSQVHLFLYRNSHPFHCLPTIICVLLCSLKLLLCSQIRFQRLCTLASAWLLFLSSVCHVLMCCFRHSPWVLHFHAFRHC